METAMICEGALTRFHTVEKQEHVLETLTEGFLEFYWSD
jgi:hypothetical protein